MKEALLNIQQSPPEKRLSYTIKEIRETKVVWILTDEHGCVMLNSDDEDCVPIWPNKEFADDWATGDWINCKAQSIELGVWLDRWTSGLEEDQVAIAIFPNPGEDGLVIEPDEFAYELSK